VTFFSSKDGEFCISFIQKKPLCNFALGFFGSYGVKIRPKKQIPVNTILFDFGQFFDVAKLAIIHRKI